MAKVVADLIAAMRHRVTIQSSSKVSDGQGGSIETWTDGATVWASIEDLSSYEKFQAGQMQSPNSHRVTMRYRNDVNDASRLKFGTRIFWVNDVINPDNRNRFLVIKALERS